MTYAGTDPEIPERWSLAVPAEESSGSGGGRASRRSELIDRSRARAWALQLHYQWESEGMGRSLEDTLADIVTTRTIAGRRLPMIRRIARSLDKWLPEIDRALDVALENWRLERLASVDRGILRIGAAEILYHSDVPPKASIQEAIHLAEAYGGAESPRFVNGVLDAVYRRADR